MTASTTFEQLYLDAPAGSDESSWISARAAFQTVLAGESVLVDLRSARVRLAQGGVHHGLEPLVLPAAELGGVQGPLVLLCADGRAAGLAAEALRRLGASSVSAVEGGFTAWCAAGMPTA